MGMSQKTVPTAPLNGRKCYDVAQMMGYYIFSCYLPHSLTLISYEEIIVKLATRMCTYKSTITVGDFNGWPTEWGKKYTSGEERPNGNTHRYHKNINNVETTAMIR
uniref:Endonuclease/exonuclease/phosphatase domain-containing protein n=1 Tax=Glossina pallidipes TaxID=7398 RepID=A0A1A9Z8N8_GLOPL